MVSANCRLPTANACGSQQSQKRWCYLGRCVLEEQAGKRPANAPWLGGYQDTSTPDYREPGGGWRWVTGEPWGYTR